MPVDATSDIIGDPAVTYVVADGVEDREAALLVRRPSGTTLIVNDLIGHVVHPHGLGANIMARRIVVSHGDSIETDPKSVLLTLAEGLDN